ncbi:sugar nucleotide-binding protein [Salinimicrobium soli]|uniref:sugar nucleotide-binding protein n=1 Tax=Salinimicrobium soli TaxID=1254399 RepID=UPI003AAECAD4
MKKILILGASGFIGNALYKELYPYFNTHGTYRTDNAFFARNKQFHQWDVERESISFLLENLRPNVIVSALRGNFDAQISAHFEIIDYILSNRNTKLIFLSSANVFDAFTNYPSYEYDKTLSQSIYGRFKIKIENALLRLPNHKYVIARVPMVYGANSPRVLEIKKQIKEHEAIEVFSNVVVNATTEQKLTQQLHYIINRQKQGVFHLGSNDLIHHNDLVAEICEALGEKKPFLMNVFDSNFDRFLAVLPKDNLLPKNLQISIQEVVASTLVT